MSDNNYGIWGLACGILSIIFAIGASVVSFLGLAFGIAGIILSKKSLDEEPGNSLGRYGFVTSIIGIVLSCILLIACVGCGMLLFTFF